MAAHRRVDGDEVALTHEFLAVMLGVQRLGVTIALDFLEPEGLIRTNRGSIIDRQWLEEASNGTFARRKQSFHAYSAEKSGPLCSDSHLI